MYQSSSQQQGMAFSYKLFNSINELVSYCNEISQKTLLHQKIKQIESQCIAQIKSKYQSLLFNYIKHHTLLQILNNSHYSQQQSQQQQVIISTLNQSIKSFLNIFSQTKTKIHQIDSIINNYKLCKLIVCDQKKLYNLKQQIINLTKQQKKHKTALNNNIKQTNSITQHISQSLKTKLNQQQLSYKAYLIYGKAINVEKHKKTSNTINNISNHNHQQLTQNNNNQHNAIKNLSIQDAASKQQVISNLQYCMSLMYQQQKLFYSKCQPNQLDDLLLTHYIDDPTLLPVLVTNQVYKYFIPLDACLLLIVPENIINNYQSTKSQTPFIFKDTLLHVYLDNIKLLSKTVYKQSFFKNTIFRGIYFVQEGQVETKSGRIVARGWVINGKCKSTTHAWKFHKVMTFFKFILHNQNIWKQFVNDLKLNNQWPIKVSDVLNLDDKVYQQIMGQQSPNFKLGSQRSRKIKFPPIYSGRLNRSFDISKLNEIQKMRHFDQKIHHLHELKQQVLKKKIQHNAKKLSMYNNRQNQSLNDVQAKEMNKRIHILSQKMNLPQKTIKTDVSRSLFLPAGESPANILITGIVQKLKSIHENSSGHNSNSIQRSSRQRKITQINKSRTKILGLKRYQDIIKSQKNHLFKGKNFYN